MATYAINYDLRKPVQNYEKLYEAIKTFPDWCRVTDSFWLVVSPYTASQIHTTLAVHFDANDKLVVTAARAPGAWNGLPDNVSEWLKRNLN